MIQTNDKLPDGTTLKNTEILITCEIKEGGKFYLQIFLEDELGA